MVIYFIFVLRERLELSRLAAIDPKSTVTTNSTTQASYCLFTFILYENINLNPTFFFIFFFEVPERFELPYQAFAEPDLTCQTQHLVYVIVSTSLRALVN